MQVSALEHCKKLAGEKSYLIKIFQDGWKPSVKEERNVNTARADRPVAAKGDLHIQAVRVLLEEDCAGHVWRFPENLVLQRRLFIPFLKELTKRKFVPTRFPTL